MYDLYKYDDEIISKYVLPSIRSEMVMKLKLKNYTQREIAELMMITPAAVSQYVSGKRGHRLLLKKSYLVEIRDFIKEKTLTKKVIQKFTRSMLLRISHSTFLNEVRGEIENAKNS